MDLKVLEHLFAVAQIIQNRYFYHEQDFSKNISCYNFAGVQNCMHCTESLLQSVLHVTEAVL